MRQIFPRILSHVAAWLAFLAIPALVLPRPSEHFPGAPELLEGSAPVRAFFFVTLNLVLIGFFYFNYFFLIPRLLTRERRWPYFASIGAVFLFIQAVAFVMSRMVLPRMLPSSDSQMMQGMGVFASFVMFSLIWASSSGIRLSAEWKKAEDRRRESENARLKAELNQLKSQLNPHFLFNTLNGIYTLALAKNDAAPAALLQLSHLLRYVMAETSLDFVPLERDLEHLRHFIALHQMRLTVKTPVHFVVEGHAAELRIAPLLFLPFVENAFKFGSSAREWSPINITMKIATHTLEFTAQNHIRHHIRDDSTGIGIANTRRRLELLYPGHYELAISEDGGMFKVFLKIGLPEQTV